MSVAVAAVLILETTAVGFLLALYARQRAEPQRAAGERQQRVDDRAADRPAEPWRLAAGDAVGDAPALARWVDGTPTALALLDSRLCFVRVNDRWAGLAGVPAADHRGRAARDLPFSVDGAPLMLAAADRALAHGISTTNMDVKGRAGRDERLHEWLVSCAPVSGTDAVGRGVAVSLVDVTDWAQRHDQRLHVQKMEAAGRLASGIAHDFNNSFGVIAAYASMADASGALDAANAARVREIIDTVWRAGALTRQLLAFGQSRIDAPPAVDVNRVVRQTLPLLGRIIPPSIRFETGIATAPALVAIDPHGLEQIVMSLVSNAVRAMPAGGTLLLETAEAELERDSTQSEGAHRPYLLLTVTDTGTGMDQATLSRVFEPFFTTKPTGQGSGMGLAAVYGIVSGASGVVWPSSEVGRGTIVRVYLPVHAPAEPARADHASVHDADRMRIVVILESPVLARLVDPMLDPGAYHVIRLPIAAVSVLERVSDEVDLVLAESMPAREDATALGEAITARFPGVPVLWISRDRDSGGADSTVAERASALSAPFTREELVAEITRVLGSS